MTTDPVVSRVPLLLHPKSVEQVFAIEKRHYGFLAAIRSILVQIERDPGLVGLVPMGDSRDALWLEHVYQNVSYTLVFQRTTGKDGHPVMVLVWVGRIDESTDDSSILLSIAELTQGRDLLKELATLPSDGGPVLRSASVHLYAVFFDLSGFTQWLQDETDRSHVAPLIQHLWITLREAGMPDDDTIVYKPLGDGVMVVWVVDESKGDRRDSAEPILEMACRAVKLWPERAREKLTFKADLPLRAGFHSGPGHQLFRISPGADGVSVEQYYDLAGVPLNVGARLCSVAPPGTVLTGGNAALICKDSRTLRFHKNWPDTYVRPIALKGLPKGTIDDAQFVALADDVA